MRNPSNILISTFDRVAYFSKTSRDGDELRFYEDDRSFFADLSWITICPIFLVLLIKVSFIETGKCLCVIMLPGGCKLSQAFASCKFKMPEDLNI